jgi:hypothetical protein
LIRIRDYVIALAGLAILMTACSTSQGFWAILNPAALVFPIYAAWALHRLRNRDGRRLWMAMVLSASIAMWCWIVVGLNVAQPTEEETTLARVWLGLVTFVVISDLTRSARPRSPIQDPCGGPIERP